MSSPPDAVSSFSASLPFEVLVVTSLSGAGKSTVLQVLEDLNFFTADGLPPAALPDFYQLLQKPDMGHFRGLAVGTDFRRGGTSQNLLEALNLLRELGAHVSLIYLEAKPETILRRYATTRRPHPFEREGLSLEEAMAVEVERMAEIRGMADVVLDTSTFSIHDLRRKIQGRWGNISPVIPTMRVNLVSFGFKYGVPSDADMVFDLRFLPNPYFDLELRPLSGADERVAAHVFHTQEAQEFRRRLADFLLFSLPLYDGEGRYRLTIGLGCTGGKHRSVAMAEWLAHVLAQAGYGVHMTHKHWKLG